MKTVIVTHEVKDYSTWRKEYDADEENRSKAGFKTTGEYQSVENPNIITIIGEAPTTEVVQGYMSNPDLRVAMEKAGVVGMPDIKILTKV